MLCGSLVFFIEPEAPPEWVGAVLALFNLRSERRHLAYAGGDGVARWRVPAGEYALCVGMCPKRRLSVVAPPSQRSIGGTKPRG